MHDFFRGARHALPIIFGYLPVGFAFGVLAVQAGLTPAIAVMMSLLVYAGSGQLIAAGLWGAGTSPAGIIMTTFIVNLRHLLMSAALTPHLGSWPKGLQAWFCFEMTDESFAANLGRFQSFGVNRAESLGLNAFAHLGWIMGSLLGALLDAALGDTRVLGLDFALPAMFIALLIPHIVIPRRLLAVCAGGGFCLAFTLLGAGQWSVILATVCGATLAAALPFSRKGGLHVPG